MIETTERNKELVEVKIDGNTDLKITMLEMTLTHLYISMTFKKIQVSHKNRRDKAAVDKKILDELHASVQRANLILSEFVMGRDAKHIVSFSVKTSSVRFERKQYLNSSVESNVNVLVGDIEGDMPVHAQNLHEVVLRNVSQLNEQMTRLEYSVPTVCSFFYLSHNYLSVIRRNL
ncbi:unnamed protein product [Gongylonema pulchrum]|uniref:Uncharacterized protein n=1 Tax=Gongylonema pulchrum TaxID=637853 RepID=A0A3P6PRG2_9BILA|nr:unnamed protein product [Gongylonema pulchrum]